MKNIHPLLDREKQQKAKRYEKEKRLLGLANNLLLLIILLAFYFSGLSEWLAHLFPGKSIILPFLVYAVSFQLIMVVLTLPLSFYSRYIHEHKWNFSNHTLKSWSWEQVKSFLVGLVLFLVVLSLLLGVMSFSPGYWWLIAGLAAALVSVIFATIFPVVILPIFNKYTPIKNEKLVDSLRMILSKGGLKSSGFFKMDMSRQTKKENAFMTGLSRTRRVVLADNLMENMTIPEIESIIAHEVGHHKYRHILKNVCIGTIQQIIVFYLLNLIMRALFPQFLSSTRWNLTLLPLFVILLGAISTFLFGPLGNAISRYFERQADQTSLEMIKDRKAFMTALAGLANRNLSNAYPEWWVKLLFYSHPPIGERLEMAEDFHF
ncbi:MAG: M48 family metallopeptidase [Candidatus Aminicenantales bacterium]